MEVSKEIRAERVPFFLRIKRGSEEDKVYKRKVESVGLVRSHTCVIYTLPV